MLRRRRNKAKMMLLVIAAGLFLSLFYVERALRHTVIALAEAEAVRAATHAINTAVLEQVSTHISYADLIKPEKDVNNQVIFMQVNTMLVNKIKSEAEIAIQDSLLELGQKKTSIPFGMVFGAKLLSNLGPMIRLVIVPMGTVHVDVADSFEAAGINQTRHRIYLNVRSDVRVVFPLLDREVPVTTQIPIADAIIVGPVPQVYLGQSLFRGF